jgi:protein-S-isoprenylcysteine O-methyltransferase Ste14
LRNPDKNPTFACVAKHTFAAPNQISGLMRRLTATFFLLLLASSVALAQGDMPPADFMRSIGTIYVVVGVIVLVFLGLAFYLWSLDRRLGDLENQIDDHA